MLSLTFAPRVVSCSHLISKDAFLIAHLRQRFGQHVAMVFHFTRASSPRVSPAGQENSVGDARKHPPWTGPIFKANVLHSKKGASPEEKGRRWKDLADSFPQARRSVHIGIVLGEE